MFELDYRTSEEIWVSVVKNFERGNVERFNEEFEKYEKALKREERHRIEEYPILGWVTMGVG